MTYTFKLSRRIARCRGWMLLPWVALAAACSGEPTDSAPTPDESGQFVLTPYSPEVDVDEPIQFRAYMLTGSGDSTPAEVEWSATGGAITAEAVFSAGAPGTYTIYAILKRLRNKIDSTQVYVRPRRLVAVDISPDSAVLAPSARQVFTARGRLRDSSTVLLAVTWSATGGTIDREGVYVAGSTPGRYHVIGTSARGIADTVPVVIVQGNGGATVEQVILKPDSVTLEPGGTQAFTASAKMSDGTTAAVQVTYTATGGTITDAGLYTAGQTPGTYRVIATAANGKADTARVTINKPPVTVQQVILTPAEVTLKPGGPQQFSVTGKMSDGTTGAVTVTYNVTGGTITAAGLYTAGQTPGTYRVIATAANGPADTSTVTITAPAPTLQQIILTPASVTLQPGATQQFSVSGEMSDGSTTSVSVVYTATGGTITAGGLYTAGQTGGTYRVIATQSGGTLADTSAVTITVPSTTGELARPADAFVNSVGVAVHLTYGDTPYGTRFYDVIKPRLIELGVRHIRDGGWNSTYYSRVNELAASGIKVLQVCDPRNISAEQCHANVKSYMLNAVEAIEGPNEYDISGDANWGTTLRNYLQRRWTLFKGDPATAHLPLVGTAFMQWQATTQIGDVSGWVDHSNMHPLRYMPPDGLRNQTSTNVFAEVQYRGTPYGHKPMFMSETSYPTCPGLGDGISETAQGKYVPRFLLTWFNAGVVRTYIYELIDERNTPCSTTRSGWDSEHFMGILRYDGSPKPAFTAVKHLLALLKDPGGTFSPGRLPYTLVGDTTNVSRMLLQKRDGRFYLVLWQAVSSFGYKSTNQDIAVAPRSLTLRFPSPVAQVRLYRTNQSLTPIATQSGTASVAVAVPDEPLVVEITR